MSFLIVFNGQFSPLVHPSTPQRGRIVPVANLENSMETVDEFKDALKEAGREEKDNHKKNLQKLDIYKQATKKFEEQKKRHHAKDIMSTPVKIISQNSSALEARDMLNNFGFRHLPVVDGNNIICGIISDREIVGSLESKTCKDIMVQKIIVSEEMASINEIAIILLNEKINALPIINHKRELTGIITQSDILKYVVESTAFLGRA